MIAPFLILLVALLVIASFLRGDFALTLIYLVLGALAAGIWWSRRSMTQVLARRQFSKHAFLGEKIKIDLHVQNKGWLPIPVARASGKPAGGACRAEQLSVGDPSRSRRRCEF